MLTVLQYLYPTAIPGVDYTLRDDSDGRGCYIDRWDLPVPPPSRDDIEQAAAPAALAAAKTARRAYMRELCEAAINAGSVCNALGADHTYPTDLVNQQNLTGQYVTAQNYGAAKAPYKFWCADAAGVWMRREHTAEQIIAVGDAVVDHVRTQQQHYEDKLAEIDAATTPEDVAAVTW